jgi:uncharacterized protein (DUF488 family)
MFYRRKVILSILQAFNNKLEKICIQKLLFLFTERQIKPVYHFIPYKYGAYSFTAASDLRALEKINLLSLHKNFYYKKDPTDYTKYLQPQDAKILQFLKESFVNFDKDNLIQYTYQHYPYYASKSIIPQKFLQPKELEKYHNKNDDIILFTIGYEGISLEEYLNKLIQNNVELLVDVRENPISRKYGFSKTKLSIYCKKINIQYLHLPEAGIPSNYRKTLKSQDDYDKLFLWYRQQYLPQKSEILQTLQSLLLKYKRIALTCFEANIEKCHRKPLSELIEKFSDYKYTIKHL